MRHTTGGSGGSASGGADRVVTVGNDGERVVYLGEGPGLWVYDVTRARARQVAGDHRVTEVATDAAARVAAFAVEGRLHRVDLCTGGDERVPAAGPVEDPVPDPTGQRIGYLTGGALHVVDRTGTDLLLAGEPDPGHGGRPYLTWGRPDRAGAGIGLTRGWWWAPDGQAVLATRVDRGRAVRAAGDRAVRATRPVRAEVSLHLLDLEGGWVDVHWDRETYPHLVNVCWSTRADPLIAVLRRGQQHGLVLAVDARTGETQVHAELADPRWVEPVRGTPCHLPDGRVLVGGELAHDGYDARCLFADGTLLTPLSLYVRRVVGRLAGTADLLVEGTSGEPSEQHLFRVGTGTAGVDTHPITVAAGWHRAAVGGDTLVIGSESLDHPGVRWTVWRDGAVVGELPRTGPDPKTGAAEPGHPRSSAAATRDEADAARDEAPRDAAARDAAARPAAGPPVSPAPPTSPRPALSRVTDRRLPAGVLYPRWHVAGRKLPVLIDSSGLEQGVRAVRADWSARQWWADAGFAVVVVDHRGTPGVAPSFEKVVHRRLADLALADLADGLAGLTGKHPDLALDRVAVKGRGVGGWLAVMAVLRRPDWFRCAVARAPVVDWADGPPGLAERYLGLPDERPEVYERHSLVAAALLEQASARPVLLLADPADPEPVASLAATLTSTARPHTVLTGPDLERAGHDEAVLDFLRRHT